MNSHIHHIKPNTGLVALAMSRPISTLILVIAVTLTAIFALLKMARDILPNLGVPIIYVAQPYGGLDPGQMESFITYYYESQFLYVSGIEHIESKSIQSTALIKLQFNTGTNMAQAMAETVAAVNRARSFMPPGTNPPAIIRFDAGSEPVGKVVFSSEKRSLAELQNFAQNSVRPLFASLKGVSAPPPFGGSARTIVIEVDPKKLRERDLSPSQVTQALISTNLIIPSGNIHEGDKYPLVPVSSVVKNPQDLLSVPLRLSHFPTTLLRDVAKIHDSADIQTGYALVNGRRTVYIPITKRADASTLSVVDQIKENIPLFQSVVPDDVKVSFEFDQSVLVKNSISSLIFEILLGAALTGLMVFLFLHDWRSVLIVVLNIPLALLFSVLWLWILGFTVNVMTLGGLALAVGILVDETMVTIENIHAHLAIGVSVPRASLDATNEIFKPALLTLLCVLSVFIPSFFMEGITRSLFVPLTVSVGFSMIGSFLLSRTLLPVLAAALLKGHEHIAEEGHKKGLFHRLQATYGKLIEHSMRFRKLIVIGYLSLAGVLLWNFGHIIGIEIFPHADQGQFQVRIRNPTGSNIEKTEASAIQLISLVEQKIGKENLTTSVGFAGTQPPNFAQGSVYLWSGGPHEAVMEFATSKEAEINIETLKDELRESVRKSMPDVNISFEPSNMIDRTMSQGSPAPIEIAAIGANIREDEVIAKKILDKLKGISILRDQQLVQRLDYPAYLVDVDREKLGIKGITVDALGQALIPATSSSRYQAQNYWRDPDNGINYQVQVEVPKNTINSLQDLEKMPLQSPNGEVHPLNFFTSIKKTEKVGEYDRFDMRRLVSVTANLSGIDLFHATQLIHRELESLVKELPKGVTIKFKGQVPALEDMLPSLGGGLLLAILVVFMLLAANFESVSLSACVLSTMPLVLLGVLSALLITHSTLNIESFMGAIMSVGVAVANAILVVTFSEEYRKESKDSTESAVRGAMSRLRPILMTSGAMLVGMIPMALGHGEGGEQIAPLGRAVMGGVIGSTTATLFILPIVFSLIQKKRGTHSASLSPFDKKSRFYLGPVED
jgi:multidrug efflux pump subunit AcrB